MQKIIVSHISPDFDGIPAIWLLKKFHPEFKNARVEYVPAGENTYNNEPVDSNPNVLHVDCGGGKFDHHHTNEFTCGAKLVYDWLIKEGYIEADDEALERLLAVVTELDHGWDGYRWAEPKSDRWEFNLHNMLVGWKMVYPGQDSKHIELTIAGLEAVYKLLKNKVKAEKEIKVGLHFKTRWGKGVAIFTANDAVMDVAIKEGYAIVFRKDPRFGNVRVTGSNKHKVNLTRAYKMAMKADPEASWFLHASKVLLRNGSARNPKMKASKLTIEEVVAILRKG